MRLKTLLLCLLTLFILFRCDKHKTSEKEDWIKTSTSDKWWKYSLFVQKHPKSKNINKAIYKSIELSNISGCFRFNLDFNSYSKEILLYNHGSIISYDSIRAITTNYLLNGISKVNKHQLKIKIPNTDRYGLISKGMFDITLPKDSTTYPYFKNTLIEISKGISDYRKILAKKWFKKSLNNLNSDEEAFLNKNIHNRLIFYRYTPYKNTIPQISEREIAID
ncbi:MAG: hypothetical protein ACPGU6_01930 [Tenacibaculum sp.]